MSTDRSTGEPQVTVVVACYNHAPYVRQALESVAAQDYPGIQLIVTDDASSDDTVDVVRRVTKDLDLPYRAIFHAHNAGVCRTYNEALAMVETPFVSFLGGDDWMAPNRFSIQVPAMLAYPDDTAVVSGDVWWEYPHGADHGPSPVTPGRYASKDGIYLSLIRGEHWVAAPSALCRTAALRAVGGYDPGLAYEDRDMWLRLAQAGYAFAFLGGTPLAHHRRHGDNLSEALEASDRESPATLRSLETELKIWMKHTHAADAEVRAHAGKRLFELALSEYRLGRPAALVAAPLRAAARAQLDPSRIVHATLATLRVPGRWLTRPSRDARG